MTRQEAVEAFAQIVAALDEGDVRVPPKGHRKLIEALEVLRAEEPDAAG